MKTLNLMIPEELLNWAKTKAARDTYCKGEPISINAVIIDLIRREMEADKWKDRPIPLTGHQCQGYG